MPVALCYRPLRALPDSSTGLEPNPIFMIPSAEVKCRTFNADLLFAGGLLNTDSGNKNAANSFELAALLHLLFYFRSFNVMKTLRSL
jgi:hypothetical protein